jgi:NAD(P)-dependent dehydrogenase (short-subunit alcohol dehydrogenase family)
MVTGAGRGIGRAIAMKLANDGFSVIATGRGGEAARETASLVGGRYFAMDVRDPASVRSVAEQVDELKVLVNCAGVFPAGRVLDVTPEEYRDVMDINVGGLLFTMQAFRPLLVRSRGAIVNVTSIAATMAAPALGVYSASKAAAKALTELAALELGPLGVRVNAVAPGHTQTESNGNALGPGEMPRPSSVIPLRRVAIPDDMASAVAFLASDEANYITGHTLTVDGGLTLGTSDYFRAANAATESDRAEE